MAVAARRCGCATGEATGRPLAAPACTCGLQSDAVLPNMNHRTRFLKGFRETRRENLQYCCRCTSAQSPPYPLLPPVSLVIACAPRLFSFAITMRPIFATLVLLALSAPAHSAVLRYVYFDQNGRDLRFETFIDKWWADRVDEVAYVPAGTPISNRTGANTLTPTSWTVPVDLTIRLQTPSPDRTARLCEHACMHACWPGMASSGCTGADAMQHSAKSATRSLPSSADRRPAPAAAAAPHPLPCLQSSGCSR